MPHNFFFQAEDGIRDVAVTGVQTCALPIFLTFGRPGVPRPSLLVLDRLASILNTLNITPRSFLSAHSTGLPVMQPRAPHPRSEERRVGKECRSRWSPYH